MRMCVMRCTYYVSRATCTVDVAFCTVAPTKKTPETDQNVRIVNRPIAFKTARTQRRVAVLRLETCLRLAREDLRLDLSPTDTREFGKYFLNSLLETYSINNS